MSVSRAKRYSKKRKRVSTNSSGGRSKFKRGFFKPLNEEKYRLPQNDYMNKGPIPEYRSGWELKLMKWCDQNPKVKFWTTEPFSINYIKPTDGQVHRYFPDFLIGFEDGTKWLIEIKPEPQWKDPINLAKWEMGEKFCKENNLIWRVMGAKELGIKS